MFNPHISEGISNQHRSLNTTVLTIGAMSKPSDSSPSRTLARPASVDQPRKPLILLCDGTWCGRETNTKSNIYKLARLIGIENPNDTDQDIIPGRACYIHGVGLGSTFLEYVLIILSLSPPMR
jgi:hypothetical protein